MLTLNPYQPVIHAREIVACVRCDRYTPSMVAKLREIAICAQMYTLLAQGMSERQARIVIEQQLESWENDEFERDTD